MRLRNKVITESHSISRNKNFHIAKIFLKHFNWVWLMVLDLTFVVYVALTVSCTHRITISRYPAVFSTPAQLQPTCFEYLIHTSFHAFLLYKCDQ